MREAIAVISCLADSVKCRQGICFQMSGQLLDVWQEMKFLEVSDLDHLADRLAETQ